ncbi:DUF2226 domain-containing protein [Thermococcus sp.]|uniref:DUF2226 domain-containing protein n=1 Tax=Thermococcus sp. TaxID=35749 RepID=UPI002635FDE3|nr:DUF2226 domain-containing protein [Thermococcus sp.]
MLPGKYLDVITDFSDPLELAGKVREGYLKLAWKSESGLKIGYVLVKEGKIVGSLVEEITGNSSISGDEAFREIFDAVKRSLIRAVEIYEADVEGILRTHPKMQVTFVGLPSKSGRDLESFLALLGVYRGGVEIQDGSKAWRIYVETGLVKAARAIKGSDYRGDDAIREILRETGHLLKDGRYTVGDYHRFSPEDTVQKSDLLREGLELVKEKKRTEKGF